MEKSPGSQRSPHRIASTWYGCFSVASWNCACDFGGGGSDGERRDFSTPPITWPRRYGTRRAWAEWAPPRGRRPKSRRTRTVRSKTTTRARTSTRASRQTSRAIQSRALARARAPARVSWRVSARASIRVPDLFGDGRLPAPFARSSFATIVRPWRSLVPAFPPSSRASAGSSFFGEVVLVVVFSFTRSRSFSFENAPAALASASAAAFSAASCRSFSACRIDARSTSHAPLFFMDATRSCARDDRSGAPVARHARGGVVAEDDDVASQHDELVGHAARSVVRNHAQERDGVW